MACGKLIVTILTLAVASFASAVITLLDGTVVVRDWPRAESYRYVRDDKTGTVHVTEHLDLDFEDFESLTKQWPDLQSEDYEKRILDRMNPNLFSALRNFPRLEADKFETFRNAFLGAEHEGDVYILRSFKGSERTLPVDDFWIKQGEVWENIDVENGKSSSNELVKQILNNKEGMIKYFGEFMVLNKLDQGTSFDHLATLKRNRNEIIWGQAFDKRKFREQICLKDVVAVVLSFKYHPGPNALVSPEDIAEKIDLENEKKKLSVQQANEIVWKAIFEARRRFVSGYGPIGKVPNFQSRRSKNKKKSQKKKNPMRR